MSPTETLTRITDLHITFERVGPVPTTRTRKAPPVYGDLVLHIPPHTARNVDAMIGYITEPIRTTLRRILPDGHDNFTITIELNGANGDGRILVDGGVNGIARIARA